MKSLSSPTLFQKGGDLTPASLSGHKIALVSSQRDTRSLTLSLQIPVEVFLHVNLGCRTTPWRWLLREHK